jgi:hypothetical protein
MGKMTPMNEILATDYGQRPEQYLADGGYAKLDDIEALAGIGIESYVPVPKPRDATRDRYAPLPSDPPGVAAWRERMGCDAAKAIYKERAATAECANAQARNRGLKQFVVRGLEKVKAIALWYALAHNMACTWRLVWACAATKRPFIPARQSFGFVAAHPDLLRAPYLTSRASTSLPGPAQGSAAGAMFAARSPERDTFSSSDWTARARSAPFP